MKPSMLLPAEELLLMTPYRQRKPQAAHPRPLSRGAHRLAAHLLARMHFTPRRIAVAQEYMEGPFFVLWVTAARIFVVERYFVLEEVKDVDGDAW